MDPYLILAGIVLWFAIFAIIYGVRLFTEERSTLARRLGSSHDQEAVSILEPTVRISLDDGFLKRFDKLVTPRNPEERSQTQQRLVLAGYRSPSAMRLFYFSRAALTVGMTVLASIIVPFFGQSMPLLFKAAGWPARSAPRAWCSPMK